MKRLIITMLLLGTLASVMPQNGFAQQDSTKTKKKSITISWSENSSIKTDSTGKPKFRKGFSAGITFTRLDLGFAKLIDNGNFTLSPANDFLDYRPGKTSTVSFDVLQMGYRFNDHFKISISGGFDWTLIRLKKDITIERNKPTITYINEPIEFSKNRFSNSYLHIPLNFEVRSKKNEDGKRFYAIVSPEVAFLLNGKVKQISKERGKEKFKDDYNFEPFRYGAAIHLGYGNFGLFTKYYLNDMFSTTAQKGLKNMSFGITFGLN